MTATAGPRLDTFHAELHEGNEVCVLRLEGALRAETAHVSEEIIGQLVAAPCPALVVDASLLSEIDQVGVDVLTELHRAVRQHHGKMMVYAATGPVARALAHSPLRQ